MTDKKQRVCIALSPAALAAVDRASEETGCSRSAFLEMAATLMVSRYELDRLQIGAERFGTSWLHSQVLRLAQADHADALRRSFEHFQLVLTQQRPIHAGYAPLGIPVASAAGVSPSQLSPGEGSGDVPTPASPLPRNSP